MPTSVNRRHCGKAMTHVENWSALLSWFVLVLIDAQCKVMWRTERNRTFSKEC